MDSWIVVSGSHRSSVAGGSDGLMLRSAVLQWGPAGCSQRLGHQRQPFSNGNLTPGSLVSLSTEPRPCQPSSITWLAPASSSSASSLCRFSCCQSKYSGFPLGISLWAPLPEPSCIQGWERCWFSDSCSSRCEGGRVTPGLGGWVPRVLCLDSKILYFQSGHTGSPQGCFKTFLHVTFLHCSWYYSDAQFKKCAKTNPTQSLSGIISNKEHPSVLKDQRCPGHTCPPSTVTQVQGVSLPSLLS